VGGEEHLVLSGPRFEQETMHELPVVIDDKEVLSCDTLISKILKLLSIRAP
jgi:hypothetical protein